MLDFRKEDLQGQQVSICRPSMRRLIGNYPSTVEKCNKEALHLMHYHQVPQQLDRLESYWKQLDTTVRAKRLDCIDRQVTELLLHAEKVCRKLRMGEVDFSPEVSKAADTWHM